MVDVHQQFLPKNLRYLNVRTNRLFWHAGAGIDSEETPDLHETWLRTK